MPQFVYNGPPDRGFEPGATYDLTYPAADSNWSAVVTQTFSAAPAPAADPAPPSDETPKETS